MALPTSQRRTTMNEQDVTSWRKPQYKGLSRRHLLCGAAGTVLGAGLATSKLAYAGNDDDDSEPAECVGPNPLQPGTPLADISDPSQITDFKGFVGLTHIRGGGTGTDTTTGATTPLAFQADMGFSRGRFIGTDGRQHRGTFAFV